MDLRGLHDTIMLNAARALASPDRLRPILDKYPDLASFAKRFGRVETALREAMDDIDEDHRERLEAVKAQRSELEAKHDAVIRQTWLALEAHRFALEPTVREQAASLSRTLLPVGRRMTNRYSVNRKLGEAQAAEERLDPPDREELRQLEAPQGTVLALHELRMDVVKELESVQDQLSGLTTQMKAPSQNIARIRRQWIRLVRAFISMMDLVGVDPEDREKVLAPITEDVEKRERQRSRREPEGSAPVPVAMLPATVANPEGSNGEAEMAS